MCEAARGAASSGYTPSHLVWRGGRFFFFREYHRRLCCARDALL